MTDLDSIDIKILDILQTDGRASHSAIADAVGLSQPSVHERVKKLEQRGVITGYTAVLNPEAINLGVLAFVSVRFGGYKTKDVAGDAWEKTKDVAENVKDKVEDKIEDMRGDDEDEAEESPDA